MISSGFLFRPDRGHKNLSVSERDLIIALSSVGKYFRKLRRIRTFKICSWVLEKRIPWNLENRKKIGYRWETKTNSWRHQKYPNRCPIKTSNYCSGNSGYRICYLLYFL